jgi:hypothetical protein
VAASPGFFKLGNRWHAARLAQFTDDAIIFWRLSDARFRRNLDECRPHIAGALFVEQPPLQQCEASLRTEPMTREFSGPGNGVAQIKVCNAAETLGTDISRIENRACERAEGN